MNRSDNSKITNHALKNASENNTNYENKAQIENTTDFYQSKYNYYKDFCFWVILFSCLASITYFVSDCQLFGRFAWETLLPRTIILLPMLIYIYLFHHYISYKIMVPISYIIIHLIMWNTIWAIVYLPDRSHASEGFIIMHLMFFALGFCSPIHYAVVAHFLLIGDIILSNVFNHYEAFPLMLSLGIPCTIAICAAHYFMQKLYVSHYLTVKQLEHLSSYDALTNVYNRNILNQILQADGIHFSSELGNHVSILLFDIDFFKSVNDTYGHTAGDKILKIVTNTVKNTIPQPNYFIRWGGEEFVLLLPDSTPEKGVQLAEQIRDDVEHTDTRICPITISVGVSFYKGQSFKTAIDNADKALYKAKNNGRNRVEYCYETK